MRTDRGELSRPQSSSVHSLSREQKALEAETRAQAEKLAAAEVFQLALSSAARDMARAAAQLDRGETGMLAQQAQQDALARLAALLEALKPSNQAGSPKKQGGEGGEGKQGGNTDAIKLISELKLLKLMQEDLNRRFQQLPDVADEAQRHARQAELSQDQGRLADVAFKLSKPLEGNPEDDPDKLPDLRKTERATPTQIGPSRRTTHDRSTTRCCPPTETNNAISTCHRVVRSPGPGRPSSPQRWAAACR